MKVHIDTDAHLVHVEDGDGARTLEMASPQAFEAVSQAWLRCGWDVKHVYSFSWLGRPIIQLPEDVVRLQELIWNVKPRVIVETGIAHGGSLVLSASMCALQGFGRVIGIDVEIRAHNRAAIEAHPLAGLITMLEGDSKDPATIEQVRRLVGNEAPVMVMLDSSHERDHVHAELEGYGPLVTPGSYIIAMDGITQDLVGAPRSREDWAWNNARRAAADFVARSDEFELCEPDFAFNEGLVRRRVTYWPGGIIRRIGSR
ncbi:MAG: cephalosporin hydroxylase family protein [Planctomycetota bacterium]|jgi:cephalosporin hydroxylase